MKKRRGVALVLALMMSLSAMPAMAEEVGEETGTEEILPVNYEMKADFDSQEDLGKFVFDSKITQTITEDGALKLEMPEAGKWYMVGYTLANGDAIDDDIVRISFKVNKAAKSRLKLMINGENSGLNNALVLAEPTFNVGTFFGAVSATEYVRFGETKTYAPADNKWAEIAFEYDLRNDRLRVFENGKECNYINNDTGDVYNGGRYMPSRFTEITKMLFSIYTTDAAEASTIYLDDISVTSVVKEFDVAIDALENVNEENAKEVVELYKKAKASAYDTYDEERFAKLEALNQEALVYDIALVDLDVSSFSAVSTDGGNISVNDDGSIRFDATQSSGSKYFTAKADVDKLDGIVNLEFNIKRNNYAGYAKLYLNSTSESKPPVTVMHLRSKYDVVPFFKDCTDSFWFDTTLNNKNYMATDYGNVKLQLNFVDKTMRIFVDGKEITYYRAASFGDITAAPQVATESYKINADSLNSIYFSTMPGYWADVKNIKITSEIDDVNTAIARLPEEPGYGEKDILKDLNERIAVIENSGLGDWVVDAEIVKESYNALPEENTDETKFQRSDDNLGYTLQNQKFIHISEETVEDVFVNNVKVTDMCEALDGEVVIDGHAFKTAGEYEVVAVIGDGYSVSKFTLTEDNRVIYNDEENGTLAKTEGCGNGDGADNKYYPEIDASLVYSEAHHNFARSGGTSFSLDGTPITFLPRIPKNRYAMKNKFYWQWNVDTAGVYNIDFYKLGIKSNFTPLLYNIEVKDKNGIRTFELKPTAGVNEYETLGVVSGVPSVFEFEGTGEEYVKITLSDKYHATSGTLAVDCIRLRETYTEGFEAEQIAVKEKLTEFLASYSKDKNDKVGLLIKNYNAVNSDDIKELPGYELYKNDENICVVDFEKIFVDEENRTVDVNAIIRNANVLTDGKDYDFLVALYVGDKLQEVKSVKGTLGAEESKYIGGSEFDGEDIIFTVPKEIDISTVTVKAFLWDGSLVPYDNATGIVDEVVEE